MENIAPNKKVLWISLYHPNTILTAIGLILLLRDRFTVNCLIENHPYWKGMDVQPLSRYCNKIIWFSGVGFSKHFFREIFKLHKVKKIIKNLDVKKDDVFVALDNKPFLDNVFMSIHKSVRKFKITVYREWNDSLDKFLASHKGYKELLTSKIWNWTIIPFFNLNPIVYLENSDRSLYYLIYKKGDKKIFDEFIYLKNYDEDASGKNEIYKLYGIAKDELVDRNKNSQKNTIVFFGEGRKHFDEYHFNFVNQCLRYIETFFPGFSYLYKPHPFDDDNYEVKNVVLGKFKLYEEKDVTELFLIKNLNNIKFCFSISSTSLESCFDMGIKSYFFIKLYSNYPKDFYSLILGQIGRLGKDAFIESFDIPPLDYQVKNNSSEKDNREVYKLDYLIQSPHKHLIEEIL